ncbi:transcriptional repressor [candidate division FCPU426 bacterium]|nr:transcriptional repressor [candidate division FCPU426 bacterium]
MHYRHTRQRKMILEELQRLDSHPTVEEFYTIIKPKMPGMGLCTVYRNLEKFSELGLIHKILGVPVRYEGNPTAHNHIKCVRCGKIEDLHLEVTFERNQLEAQGYQLHAYALEINGICPQCRSRQEQ